MINLLDYLPSLKSIEEKQKFVYSLDSELKKMHDQNKTIVSLDPYSILVDEETKKPFFSENISFRDGFMDLETWKKLNTLWLADLEVCIYLYPNYNLDYGLMSLEALSTNFSSYSGFLPSEDVDYYRQIFDGDYYVLNKKPSYLSSLKKSSDGTSLGSSLTYVKSTPAGRAMANKNEVGSINYIFITCVVFSLLVLTILLAMIMV